MMMRIGTGTPSNQRQPKETLPEIKFLTVCFFIIDFWKHPGSWIKTGYSHLDIAGKTVSGNLISKKGAVLRGSYFSIPPKISGRGDLLR
jgi:hypothetical protein